MKSAREEFFTRRSLKRWALVPWTLAVLLLLASLTARPVNSQLQQSGGPGANASVGATGSAVPASGTYIAGTNSGTLTGLAVNASGQVGISNFPGTQAVSGTVTVNALPAGTNLIGYSRPQNGCGTTNYESGLAFLPNASTSLTAVTTCVFAIILNNVTAGPITVTVQDQTTNCNAGACQELASFSIPANSQLILPLYGMKFTTGIKWNASASNSIVGDVIGNQ